MKGVTRTGSGVSWALQIVALATGVSGCGRLSSDERPPATTGGAGGGQAVGGAAGSEAGTAGAAGSAAGSQAGAPPGVPTADDPVVCDAGGRQVARDAAGQVAPTGRICTVKVIVDDETSIPCATKADGSYRCWSSEGATPLPVGDYSQVQQGTEGYVALTRDGRVVAPDMQPTALSLPVVELTSTNMWGSRSLCYRTETPGQLWIWHPNYNPDLPLEGELLRSLDAGPFEQSLCVYEGLAYGVRPNHDVWSLHDGAELGANFVQIAANAHFMCGVKSDGSIGCANGWAPLQPNCIDGYATPSCADPVAGPVVPSFPSDTYTQVATSLLAACAITAARTLVCLRGDGYPLPSLPGRYTAVAAGGHVICAIRVEGTTACWQHATGQPPRELSQLTAYTPSPDVDW